MSSGLTGSMLIAVHALMVQESALSVTSNNIANANTPGYSRQVAVLSEAAPVQEAGVSYGTGVKLDQVTSIRDRLLELRINDETQRQTDAQAQLGGLQQVESLFNDPTKGIGADITAFFNSLNQLSTDPTSIPQRQAVLTAANNVATDFHSTVTQLTNIRNNLNLSVSQAVNQINQINPQIAALNTQIAALQSLGQDAGTLEDQRTQLMKQLSGLADIAVIQSDQGYTITTSDGSPLVVAGQSYSLQTSPDSAGMQHIYSQGRDVTATMQGGQIGGLITVRDQVIPQVIASLDDLAGGLATNFNTAHQAGFDLVGNAGQDFFGNVSGAGAAANFSVQIMDPSLIAASSDGSAGSNGNLTVLQAVQTQTLPTGPKPMDLYSQVVFTVGNATAQAKARLDASDVSLQQLNDQRGAISGVSIDEETTNLIRFQHAYQASARVISVVDELTQTIMNMLSQ
jgi:flagellar hook-associated protein 1 FlgK